MTTLEKFTQAVIAIIKAVPEGRVMTYGQVARIAGNPRGARQVVRILHSMSEKHDLPWHRIINSQGHIGKRAPEMVTLQKDLLEAEGVIFCGRYEVNLDLCLFEPEN